MSVEMHIVTMVEGVNLFRNVSGSYQFRNAAVFRRVLYRDVTLDSKHTRFNE